VVLILDYHGRHSSLLTEFPLFFQSLLEWCSMTITPDPNNFRTALAERLAENPPNGVWAYTERNVVMGHGLIVAVFDATIAGRSTNFETEAAFLQLPARPATPIQPPPASLPLPASIQMGQPDLLQPAPVIAPPLRVLSNYIPPAQNDYRDQHDRRSSRDLREDHDSTRYRRDYSPFASAAPALPRT